MAVTSAALMRGLLHIALGSGARHVGHVLLCRLTQSLKHSRQKLCWHGACAAEMEANAQSARVEVREPPPQGRTVTGLSHVFWQMVHFNVSSRMACAALTTGADARPARGAVGGSA